MRLVVGLGRLGLRAKEEVSTFSILEPLLSSDLSILQCGVIKKIIVCSTTNN